jgi:hypothetical protein
LKIGIRGIFLVGEEVHPAVNEHTAAPESAYYGGGPRPMLLKLVAA